MPSEMPLDLESLVRPISDESPAGLDPRENISPTSPFRKLQYAYDAAKAAEKKLADWESYSDEEKEQQRDMGVEEIRPPDWRAVETAAVELLESQAKDLWATSWLLEALVRRHGFPGLAAGYRLTRELCENDAIWSGIHPRPGDGDTLQYTVARLNGLGDGGLNTEILRIPITSEDNSVGRFTGIDFNESAKLDTLTDENTRERMIKRGAVPLETIRKAARESGADFCRNLVEDIDAALQEFEQMNRVLESRCGKDAPASTATRKALEEARHRMMVLAKELIAPAGVNESSDPLDGSSALIQTPAGGPSSVAPSGAWNRDQAFRALLQVADFFRRTEPHSPVSDALEQAVRWGQMSFRELMEELLADESARKEVFRRTGTRNKED